MIKKILKSVLSLGIITLGIINFSNASAIFGQAIVGNTAQNVINNSLDVMVGRYVEFNSSLLGTNKRVFASFPESVFYRDLNGRLSVSFNAGSSRPVLNGNLKYFWVCDQIVGDFVGFQNLNCTRYVYSENIPIINNMLSFVDVGDLVIYGDSAINRGSSSVQPFIAISIQDLEKTVLFNWGVCLYNDDRCSGDYGFNYRDFYYNGDYLLENTTNNGYNFSTIPNNIIGVSPVYTGGSDSGVIDGGISIGSQESAINYFESNYGRDSSICYVGINNITDLWGTSVSFNEGSGLSIFQVYDQLYGTGDLNHYYVFLNNWLLNYEQWFNTSGDPMYLSNYNSGTNQVELYYDNLSFPFANNPIALYFMSNNISLKSPGSTMGSEVVSYCNLKLNNGTFEEIIDQSSKNNITNYTEQSNVNKGYNSDGTKKTTDYSQFGGNTGNSNSGSGNLSLSGVEIAFSGNTSLKNTLTNFIDYLKGITNYDDGTSNLRKGHLRKVRGLYDLGILPKYIVLGFIFVVLFKFLRRR